MEPVVPRRLIAGRYLLGPIIGHGGMGVVWQAHDELLSRGVAMKELVWPAYFSEAEREAACRRASREAQLAARLNHRNVIQVFDIVEEDGCPWIVMEHIPCRSLRDVIKEEGPLSPGQAAGVGLEILAALRAAHAEGIVHRDVKPANILMAPDRAVLTDFGIARGAGAPALTTVGVLVGSPSYISPERARGGQFGAPGDLWGLGASLYAAVEGRGPFDRDDALASLIAVVIDEPETATRAGPLGPVISGLLRKDPDERLDAAGAERMLRGAAAALADPASVAVPVLAATPRPRRSPGPMIVLTGSAALIVIAASSTALGLAFTSSPRHQAAPAAASTPPAAASTPAPAARAHPSSGASIHPRTTGTPVRTSAAERLAARTSRARTSRSVASRPTSAIKSSTSQKAGSGTAYRGWSAVWVSRFIVSILSQEWRSRSFHWQGPVSGGVHGDGRK